MMEKKKRDERGIGKRVWMCVFFGFWLCLFGLVCCVANVFGIT
jgi:uncharacterized membrane protein YccF (DUF307 family)